SIYLGTIFGSSLAGWMALRYGWQSPFWTLALAGITLGLVVQLFIREPKRNQGERRELSATSDVPEAAEVPIRIFLAEFLRTPTAVSLVTAFFFANMVGLVFLTWMPTFLKEKFHL